MGLKRKSGEVLNSKLVKISSASSTAIRVQTFLDCVLAEMSTSNSKPAVFFKELDKRCRKFGKDSFEQISDEASKAMDSIKESIGTFELARKMVKEVTGSDISYEIDIENNAITLIIGDRIYTFTADQFNYDTIMNAFQHNLYYVKSQLHNSNEKKYQLQKEILDLQGKALRKRIPLKINKKIAEKRKELNTETSIINGLNDEKNTLDVICNVDSQYALAIYKAINAIVNEYYARRALRHLNKRASVYMRGSYNVEDMKNALSEMSIEIPAPVKIVPNEYYEMIEEAGRRGEYDFNMVIPEDIEKLRELVEWYIDNVYAPNEELTDGVSRKRTKKDNN